MEQNTFRCIWDKLADHVCTSPHRVVTWYESDAHRLRLTCDPATGEMRLYIAMVASWRLLETCMWPVLEPRVLMHRAREVLICERDKRFPERPAAELAVGREVRCRRDGRLRTVSAGER